MKVLFTILLFFSVLFFSVFAVSSEGSENQLVVVEDGKLTDSGDFLVSEEEDDEHPSTGSSLVAVSNNLLIFGTIDGNIYGVDAETGQQKWVIPTGKIFSAHNRIPKPKDPSSTASSSLGDDEEDNESDGPLLVPSVDGSSSIFAITPGQNSVHKLPISIRQLVENSPMQSGDLLYIGSKESHVYVIDTRRGILMNTFSTKSNEFLRSCPIEPNQGIIFIGRTDYKVHAIDKSTGVERWNISTGEYISSSSIIGKDGGPEKISQIITLGTELDGTIFRVDPSGRRIWNFKPGTRAISAYSVEGEILKRIDWLKQNPSSIELALSVFIGKLQGHLYAIENPSFPTQGQAIANKDSPLLLLPGPSTQDSSESQGSPPQCLDHVDECPLGVFNISVNSETQKILPPIDVIVVEPELPATLQNEVPWMLTQTGITSAIGGILAISASGFWIIKRRNSLKKPVEKKKKKKSNNKAKEEKKSESDKESDNKETPKAEKSNLLQIGKLQITPTVLGYGSSGTIVFEGYLDGRKVAVKRLLSAFFKVAQQEISLLIESDFHNNVVTYYAKEETEEFVYLALTYCPMTLADFVERNLYEPSEPRIATMLHDLAKGLAHLHSLNIVHRDLKPQNILIGPKNVAMISDMGLAKKLELDQTSFSGSSTGSGSLGWQPAEVLTLKPTNQEERVRSRFSKKVDIFAYGCIVYYVMTKANHPFGDRFEREINIIRGKYDIEALANYPECYDLLLSCIQADPAARPTVEEILSHPFFWPDDKKLLFLKDASDRLEIEKPGVPIVVEIESQAKAILGDDWKTPLDSALIDNLGKYRKYDFGAVRDLLRVIRNKSHHYRDLEEDVQKALGPLPSGFLNYFLSRFPQLLIRTWKVIFMFCKNEETFRNYFHSSFK